MQKPAVFSFFSGLGFLDLGFENSGFEIVYVNEKYQRFLEGYKYSRKILGINKPKLGYENSDLTTLLVDEEKSNEIKSNIQEIRQENRVIGFIGGPPCPDFSTAGKNKGRKGDNGKLSGTFVSLINKLEPDFFLFENVKGLWKTGKHRSFYNELKKRLKPKYELTDKIINAIEYGVPQNRERIILVGFNTKFLNKNYFRKDKLTNLFPWENHTIYSKEKIFKYNWATTEEFKENSKRPFKNSVPKELTVQYWFDKNDVDNHKNAEHHFIPRSARSSFEIIEEGDDSRKSSKRLHRWRYSPTAAYGNNEVHLHPYKVRRLSAAESLAIQSMPKEFELPGDLTLTDMFKGIGNGVPYLASEGLAKSIHDFLDLVIND